MECKKETNLSKCNCTYEPCPRKGMCCDCLRYHLRNRELPACFFPKEAERTYDRSFEFFVSLYRQGKI
ncbi:cytosolic protein [Bacteroidetes/Chlorobi group bacterium MS-B_bin-24]|nr:MAG: cytosolic protein [Bacteroidetes/Chlorobi group bacterium MS-B_bin-24]